MSCLFARLLLKLVTNGKTELQLYLDGSRFASPMSLRVPALPDVSEEGGSLWGGSFDG